VLGPLVGRLNKKLVESSYLATEVTSLRRRVEANAANGSGSA
jgi:hypothetical protein